MKEKLSLETHNLRNHEDKKLENGRNDVEILLIVFVCYESILKLDPKWKRLFATGEDKEMRLRMEHVLPKFSLPREND